MSKTAYVFPGQGAQFPGMGKDLYETNTQAKALFDQANAILGFDITNIMFEGTPDELKQTKVTQPAIFLHSVIKALTTANFIPDMVAGHSLGEFSALVAAKALSFEDGLRLVYQRALAMQEATELSAGTMAAVLGLGDDVIKEICASVNDVVIAANFNCPGQVVISGSTTGVEAAGILLKEAGAKRVLPLPVGGAFHSPLMEPAREKLAKAIEATDIHAPICPIYQNVNASASTDPSIIKENLVKQLTGAVLWTQSVQAMVADGASQFIECGPGNVLQGLVKKIEASVETSAIA
jgi:[acyl-carrier-protein] S-malonyltransferase